MHALTLAYHDVVENGDFDASGRTGAAAATFKLTAGQFRRHVAAVASAIHSAPAAAPDLIDGGAAEPCWLITFDDGGSSGYDPIAGILESVGWRGHFLVTTDYIGRPGFLSAGQIRELRRRGHIIGSHSCSHPTRMSACDWPTLTREWATSVEVLSDLLGEAVTIASMPGGYYSRAVAEAAAMAGTRVLFTSEPTTRCATVDGCLVLGRYSVRRRTSESVPAALAAGRRLPRARERAFWEAKKVAKAVGGEFYLKLRKAVIR